MFKKYRRGINVRLYETTADLDGHMFAYGRIGAAKTCTLLSLSQGFLDVRNYKVFDLFGGERNEGKYWTLPNEDIDFWKKCNMIGNLDEEGPKQYNVNLLYPYFESKLPDKLPKKLIKQNKGDKLPEKELCVNSKVFTIPLKNITIEDIKLVLSNVPDTARYMLGEIVAAAKKTDNAGALSYLSNKFKATNTSLYKNFLLPMYREKLLADKYCEYNLDIISEIKNKEVVTVLCLDFVPNNFKLFVINYILRQIKQFIDTCSKTYKKNILIFREASAIFKSVDDSIIDDTVKAFKNLMTNYIRYGRRGMYFFLDTQSSSETKGMVQGSEDFLIMCKITSWRDKEEICSELRREKRMTSDQIADLANLKKGEAYIVETGKVAHKYKLAFPRTMYWKKEYPDFYKVLWERYGGHWIYTNEVKDYINERFVECNNKYKEKKSIKVVEKSIIKEKEAVKEKKEPSDNMEVLNVKEYGGLRPLPK